MPHQLVVNIKNAKCDIYCGRRKLGMHYGNPFSHLSYGLAEVRVRTRDEACDAYEMWIRGEGEVTDTNGVVWDVSTIEPSRKMWIVNRIYDLRGKILGCYCAPQHCHCDTLARMANGY